MENLVVFLFLLDLILLFIGLIRPNIFKRFFRGKTLNRKFILKIFGISAIVLFIIIAIIAEPVPQKDTVGEINIQKVNESGVSSHSEELTAISKENTDVGDKPIVASEKNTDAKNKTFNVNQQLYLVTQVVDGDTIKVNLGGKIETLRLIGIDTPEIVDPRKPVQCFAKEASNKAKEILSNQEIILEADDTQGERDKYDRLLRYVFLKDGTSFNKLMIAEGYAHEYTYQSNPYKYQSEFKEAEKMAREAGKGLWGANTCNGDTSQPAEVESDPIISSPTGVLEGPQVKKSTSDICHEKGNAYYERTTNFQSYSSIEECLNSGGRLPK